ncbi:hypothetical protein DICVIV_05210 [Dictyocaulus viviparus]|uniref:Uncharacterized protein n=1 Tax=Dictyocaulus viviparus TaxID=29172 RepID=A0A0D8Y229_DICVI|nr:hypothetical protein DICVIV_05210 [Dictyocaulus viviparus]
MYAASIFIFFTLFISSESLKCYVGSKGLINGLLSTDFAENDCEEGMTHCFDSFSDDLTEITASCQTLNTDKKLLDVCKIGCQNHTQLQVTVCCCDEDLCNLPDSEKPTGRPSVSTQEVHYKLKPLKLSSSL